MCVSRKNILKKHTFPSARRCVRETFYNFLPFILNLKCYRYLFWVGYNIQYIAESVRTVCILYIKVYNIHTEKNFVDLTQSIYSHMVVWLVPSNQRLVYSIYRYKYKYNFALILLYIKIINLFSYHEKFTETYSI